MPNFAAGASGGFLSCFASNFVLYWVYHFFVGAYFEMFKEIKADYVIFGHEHVPGVFCKGKKNYDKREVAAEKDAKRNIERSIKERY